MTQFGGDADPQFGGDWTLEKLNMLENYLNAYTTVMKNQDFSLIYIDGFAGTGSVKLKYDKYVTQYTEGSVMKAVAVKDRQFTQLFCVEKDQDRYMRLKQRLEHCDRCVVKKSDFNDFIECMKKNWNMTRGVVFIDPFGADVNWSTIKRIAGFKALDMWLLYPTSAITRMFPKGKLPDEAVIGWNDKLTTIFGGDEWKEMYSEDPQQTLTGKPHHLRDNTKKISKLYQRKLRQLFENRFLNKTYEFKTHTNTVLFEFMFCVGNPSGIPIAKRLANHILKMPGESSKS